MVNATNNMKGAVNANARNTRVVSVAAAVRLPLPHLHLLPLPGNGLMEHVSFKGVSL